LETLKLSDVLDKPGVRRRVVESMRRGDVIVYPTDTIYGIGCDAGNPASVGRIRRAKGRDAARHFSVIAPGKEWIWENARLSKLNRDLADRLLPGPYTLIVRAGRSAPRPVVSPEGTLGVRLPRHPFTDVVSEAGVPFVTTSVNVSGDAPAASLSEVPASMEKSVDIAVDAGRIEGRASRIFDFTTDDIKAVRRR